CNAARSFVVRGPARGAGASAVADRCGAAGDPVPLRPDGAAAELPALRRDRVPVCRGAQDRHVARLSRCLDRRLPGWWRRCWCGGTVAARRSRRHRFAPPANHMPVELCVITGRHSPTGCSETLVEWLPAKAVPASVAVADPDETVYWPMVIRALSRPVRI